MMDDTELRRVKIMELLYDTLTPENLVVSADDRGLMEKVRPPRDPTTCRPRCACMRWCADL